MTALCPMDRGPGPRHWFKADRSAADMMAPDAGQDALFELMDDATGHCPDGLERAASLEASARLAAIHAAHGVRLPGGHPIDRLLMVERAAMLRDLAEGFRSFAVHL